VIPLFKASFNPAAISIVGLLVVVPPILGKVILGFVGNFFGIVFNCAMPTKGQISAIRIIFFMLIDFVFQVYANSMPLFFITNFSKDLDNFEGNKIIKFVNCAHKFE